ncbi:MAG: hypothetical protein KAX16_01145, partial [Actinomycetia bacterium]|nr:hypothetical protein [Actinomycetes bacterium]
ENNETKRRPRGVVFFIKGTLVAFVAAMSLSCLFAKVGLGATNATNVPYTKAVLDWRLRCSRATMKELYTF